MIKRCFQYFSDLHLEKKLEIPKIAQVADKLLLAGDIGYPNTEIYNEFFKQCSTKYEQVFVVDGNHEWDKGTPDLKRFEKLKLDNIVLLNNSHVELKKENVVVIGTTLWTETVRGWEYNKAVEYLTKTLPKYKDKRVIVLSHHLPTWHLIAPYYRKKYPERMLYRYATHLDYFFHREEAPWLWVCGHSHSIVEKQIGKTRCVINTKGESHASKKCIED